jgi:D-threo-aldose 1-dehydrogenase
MPDVAGRLGYGAAGVGNHLRAVTDDEAHALLEAAWDSGVRQFDTAPHYGLGLSERRVGAFLATKPRAEYVLSTKVGRLLEVNPGAAGRMDDEDFVVPADLRRSWDFTETGIRRSLEASLGRLGLDDVDVLYLHDPERWHLDRALDEGLEALNRLRAEGIVTTIGVASMATEALLAGARSGAVDQIMVAGRLTLADQSAAVDVLPACRQHGVAVVAAAVFNGGLLASTPRETSTFDYRAVPPGVLDRARRIATVCESFDVPLTAAALQYPFLHDPVRSVVVGGATPEQIRQNAEHLSVEVPAECWSRLLSDELVTR